MNKAFLFTALLPLALFAQDSPDSVTRGTKKFSKRVVISGLANPWEVTWGPDGFLWITERSGKRVTRVNPANGEKFVAATIDEVRAPGGQDGLLGLTLHPELGKGTGNDFVYAFYTYEDRAKGPDPLVPDPKSPYHFLYGKIVRFHYADGRLSNASDIATGLPTGNDHTGGRIKFGPDKKLYLTIGDMGHNQLGNFCLAAEPQRLPTKEEIGKKDYVAYVGKSLRFNLDGTIPADNPKLNGVVSHVYTYGHRNPQGLDFAPDGNLYSSEHGPKTDDEVNRLVKGGNYGWPNVAGFRDGNAFEYARWSDAKTPCSQLKFSDLAIHPSVPREQEADFKPKMVNPLATMFTVKTGFNFEDPACNGINYICWPTTGVSSLEHYQSKGVPGWDRMLLMTTLKRGSLYVLPLAPNGKAASGKFQRYFQSENRYRDTAVSPDGKTIYIVTDSSGLTESNDGGVTRNMADKGAVLAFTYEREGTAEEVSEANKPRQRRQELAQTSKSTIANAIPPSYTKVQSAAGKTAYNASCAVCHGNTMTNGTMGTPLADRYFKNNWQTKSVRALYEKSRKTMPPAAPNSLQADVYANIVAYILETNGFPSGYTPLDPNSDALDRMEIK
ncbi:MAG: quinoprotein glucose dehydrogenase [Acidobacteria bacterium]|nr:quinoprotein glucose dehydrogenase [Acidobacteriota bacterium]